MNDAHTSLGGHASAAVIVAAREECGSRTEKNKGTESQGEYSG
jgi:hypothetical protein